MATLIKRGTGQNVPIEEYVVDTNGEINDLPITSPPGSTAYVAGTQNLFMMNHSGQWILQVGVSPGSAPLFAPRINDVTDTWEVYDATAEDYVDTGVPATGPQGDPGEVTTAQMNQAISLATAPLEGQIEDLEDETDRLDNILRTLLQLDSWRAVQSAVRLGLGPYLYPTGTEFEVEHLSLGTLVFEVVAHDYLKEPDASLNHTMTLLLKHLQAPVQFNVPQAFYFADEEQSVDAGTYNFTLTETFEEWEAGTYEFTLTEPLPASGQLYLSGNAEAGLDTLTVRSFSEGALLEEVAITLGDGGTALGSFGDELNDAGRVAYGGNNYEQSGIRQFLHEFADSLDSEFTGIIGEVVLPCVTNSVYELEGDLNTPYELLDSFYLPSEAELFDLPQQNIDGSTILPYYEGADDSERVKTLLGDARNWITRSPIATNSYGVVAVEADGSAGEVKASSNSSFAVMCTIV